MNVTPYHAKYYAYDLTRRASSGLDRLSMSLFDAAVDLNPHQIEAARPDALGCAGACLLHRKLRGFSLSGAIFKSGMYMSRARGGRSRESVPPLPW